jgi:hypothetical protein
MGGMDLTLVLQRLYDSEINVTITTLWDDGFDFALISYMEWEEAGVGNPHGREVDPYMWYAGRAGPRRFI